MLLGLVWSSMTGSPSAGSSPLPPRFRLSKASSNFKVTTKWKKKRACGNTDCLLYSLYSSSSYELNNFPLTIISINFPQTYGFNLTCAQYTITHETASRELCSRRSANQTCDPRPSTEHVLSPLQQRSHSQIYQIHRTLGEQSIEG
jgi:hypothetical protein